MPTIARDGRRLGTPDEYSELVPAVVSEGRQLNEPTEYNVLYGMSTIIAGDYDNPYALYSNPRTPARSPLLSRGGRNLVDEAVDNGNDQLGFVKRAVLAVLGRVFYARAGEVCGAHGVDFLGAFVVCRSLWERNAFQLVRTTKIAIRRVLGNFRY